MTALFQRGDFTLASGRRSGWKIECDALTAEDWATLAAVAVERFGRPGPVSGVPRGGVPFADALADHSIEGGPLWVVDDVLTTGGSLTRHMTGLGNMGHALVVVAFARCQAPPWVYPLFQTGG